MRPENINTVCHRWISEIVKPTDIAIDMTMGNGFDTLFLANLCQQVYAFDIQEEALKNTAEKVKDFNNVELILDSHANVDKYVKEKVNIFVFNLGYLPKGDETITTKTDSTLVAIKKALEMLDGNIFITFYVGHAEGKKEHEAFKEVLDSLNCVIVRSYNYFERHDSPVLYQITTK